MCGPWSIIPNNSKGCAHNYIIILLIRGSYLAIIPSCAFYFLSKWTHNSFIFHSFPSFLPSIFLFLNYYSKEDHWMLNFLCQIIASSYNPTIPFLIFLEWIIKNEWRWTIWIWWVPVENKSNPIRFIHSP